jgi:tripartite-type tricarboxylate transporter receptor subunit TctC
MKSVMRWCRHAGSALAMLWLVSGYAQPISFPDKPITIVSPYAPGGSDIAIRQYTNWISKKYPNWLFVIEFKPGAQGAIAYSTVAKSAPDGYMLTQISSTVMLTEVMVPKPAFSMDQFSAVFELYATPQIMMVHNSVAASNLKELVAYAKANPGKLNFAILGMTGIQRMTAEYVQELLGVKFTFIPYKGTAAIGPAIIAGEVDATLQSPRNTTPMTRAGKVRALAHTGQNFRFQELPEVKNFAESGGPDFVHVAWTALAAPVNTPYVTRAAINSKFNEPFSEPGFEKAFLATGDVPVRNTIPELERFMQGEKERWLGAARRLGIQLTAD